MIGWKVTEFGKIEKTKHQELLSVLDSVKVKLIRALVTEDDIAYICGEDKSLQLPIIPVRHAVGQITETAQPHDFISKGSRVVLSSIEPCGEFPACESGHPENCYNFGIAGRNRDGFLKDFAVTNVSNVFTLPASVKDADAVYVEHVALALSIIDKLNVQKSSHVAIIGGGVFASILGQILIYYQAVPIIIDDKESNLRAVKKSGIYYTISASNKPEKEISTLTGGRMANSVVYLTRSGISTDLAYKIASHNAPIVFAGYSYPNLKIPMNIAMSKQNNTSCVNNGYGNYLAAINLLANKAIDLSVYSLPTTKMQDIETEIGKMVDDFEHKKPVNNILVNLLD